MNAKPATGNTPSLPVTPMKPSQKRLAAFKANKRAWWSFIIFMTLFGISLFSEFIANDKPIFVSYQGEWYFPAMISYPETTFDGDFDTEADYTDPYVANLINSQGYMVWPIIPYSYDTHIQDLGVPAPSAPTGKNWLGTDDQARDVFARILYGFRISVLFAIALTIGSSIIGVAIGAMQGYFAGWTDLIGQRLLEIWSGLPVLFLLIIMSSMVTPNIWWLLLIMLLFSWTSLVDVVRAETLKTRKLEYVTAARALGLTDMQILFRHILPNALVATMTYIPFIMSGAIGTLTSLDFLGFGLPPASASLGELLAQGKANIQAPWLGLSGFFCVSILLTLLVFIGEGVRDAFDPRLNH